MMSIEEELDWTSRVSGGRPSVPVGRRPPGATHQLVVFCRHAGDAPPLAPAPGGEALNLHATAGSTTDRAGDSSVDYAVCAGESTSGYQRIVGELKSLGVVVSATGAAVGFPF